MKQTILDFPYHNDYNLEDFVVSAVNEQAFNIINDWPAKWGVGTYKNSLILCGEEKSGKTHLSHIWQQKAGAVFLKPDDNITSKLASNNAFIIEDIDKYLWQEDLLLHIFNIVHSAEKYLLITSKLPVKFLAINLRDLASRLKAVLDIKILMPDEDMIRMIIIKHFSQRSLNISPELLHYIANRISRNFSDIFDVIKKIDELSLVQKRNITIPLVRNIL